MDELASGPTSRTSQDRPYYSRNIEFHQLAKRDADFRVALKAASEDGFINFQNESFVQYVSKLERASKRD
jgi:23S rRNA (adenine1618-N6)-methyltransferase